MTLFFQKIPENWISVAEKGNPPSGLYVALYRFDDALIVSLVCYFESSGWAETPNDDFGDYITRKVEYYLPANYDLKSLNVVRSKLA